MNDPLIDRDDYQKNLRLQELRAELDAMGYHVIRKDWVRKFGVMEAIGDHDRLRPHWANIKTLIHRRMGAELGHGMFASGAVKTSEETSGFGGFHLRAEVSILLRDPQFDKPAWAT